MRARVAVVDDVRDLLCVEVEVDRREVDPRALGCPGDLEIVGIVVHEDRDVGVEPESAVVQQLRELVRAVVQLPVRDRVTARGHHESGLVGVLGGVRCGPHGRAG